MIEELKRMHKIRMIKFHDEKNKKEIHKLVKIPDFPYRVPMASILFLIEIV